MEVSGQLHNQVVYLCIGQEAALYVVEKRKKSLVS
jgi:hypothetical protein